MQKLKPEIQNKIINNARNIFYEKGYEATTMRYIAWKTKITVGNIYRYFKNKEALFDTIVSSTYEQLIALVNKEKNVDHQVQLTPSYLNAILFDFSALCMQQPKEIVILLERYFADGSYERLAKLEQLITKRISDVIPSITPKFVDLITHIVFEGTLYTIQTNKKDELSDALVNLFTFIFQDIVERVH